MALSTVARRCGAGREDECMPNNVYTNNGYRDEERGPGSFSCQFGGVGYRHVERRGTWTKSDGGLREGARPAREERRASSPAYNAGAVDGGDALRSKELVRHSSAGTMCSSLRLSGLSGSRGSRLLASQRCTCCSRTWTSLTLNKPYRTGRSGILVIEER